MEHGLWRNEDAGNVFIMCSKQGGTAQLYSEERTTKASANSIILLAATSHGSASFCQWSGCKVDMKSVGSDMHRVINGQTS